MLASQLPLDGFLGFEPTPDGFSIAPALPPDWPSLAIEPIAIKDHILRVKVTQNTLETTFVEAGPLSPTPLRITHPQEWKLNTITGGAREISATEIEVTPTKDVLIRLGRPFAQIPASAQ